MTDWKVAREAVREGKVVFFPRLTTGNVWSIFSYDRKRGLRMIVRKGVYQECPGAVAWRFDEDAGQS